MKNIIPYLSLVSISVWLFSCTKVIQLDLADSGSKVVIEAILNDSTYIQTIYISLSKGINDSGEIKKAIGASVKVIDDQNTKYTFADNGDGSYTHANFMPQNKKTYKLEVNYNGENYTAYNTMPSHVDLDTAVYLVNNFFTNPTDTLDQYFIVPIWKDNGNEINFYNLRLSINGKFENTIDVRNDDIINGNYAQEPYFPANPIYAGDTVMVELNCISQNIFDYFSVLASNIGGQTIPANPVSNISNNALGYFSVQTRSIKTLIIKP